MATILNRLSKELIPLRNPGEVAYITISNGCIFFSKELRRMAGISRKNFLHFIFEGDYWAFIVNDDSKGFPIASDGKLYSQALMRLYNKSAGNHKGNKYIVIKTNSELNGYPVFEIYTKESVQVKIDREKRIREQRRKVLQIKIGKR